MNVNQDSYMVGDIPGDLALITPRCRLQRISHDDASHLWSAIRHPGFIDGLGWDWLLSMAHIRQKIKDDHISWAEGTRVCANSSCLSWRYALH